ncbi:MAG TPA: gluconokinase [Steroidobacteraceae bacterium]
MSAESGVVLIVLGVSGAGKTTVGRMLAERLGFEYYEGDDYHSESNRAKMAAGIPLNDEDRRPWLLQIRAEIDKVLARRGSAVFACSALKQAYRDLLRREGVHFVYLHVSRECARERLRTRKGHFFNPMLLDSQFETLEEPRDAIVVDAGQPVEQIVEQLVRERPWERRAGA